MKVASNDMPMKYIEVSSGSLRTSDCIKPGEHVNAIGKTSCAKLRREDDGEQGLSGSSWRETEASKTCFQCGIWSDL